MQIKSRDADTSAINRFIYIQQGNILCTTDGIWLHSQASEVTVKWLEQPLFVAELDATNIYMQVIEDEISSGLQAHHGRDMMTLLTEAESDLLARALQLSHWLQDHQFCGRCGRATTLHKVDYGMYCEACRHTQYPRISPCIIVVVTGPKGVLLARNTRFPEGRFSALAGFVEAGESVEAAVHREVKEEVGIDIKNLQYIGSQSWSFPHSLMMGYMAEYKAGEIAVDGVEIDEADWFRPDCLPDLPFRFSIARRLVDIGLAKIAK